MSIRKSRVHHTGLSNNDKKNLSLSPIKQRPLLHEPKIVVRASVSPDLISPSDDSIQKYKTWNKKFKSSQSPVHVSQSLHDPPEFAKIGQSKYWKTGSTGPSGSLAEAFSGFIKENSINLKSKFIQESKKKGSGINCQDFYKILEAVHAPSEILKFHEELYKDLSNDSVLKIEHLEPFFNKKFELSETSLNKPTEERFVIIDKKLASPYKLEVMLANSVRIKGILASKYKKEENLREELEKLGKNSKIFQEDLKNFLLKQDQKLEEKEVQALLSSYDYNKDRQTDIKEVAKYVFMDKVASDHYISLKKRAVPPDRPVNYSQSDRSKIKSLLLGIEKKMFTEGSNVFYNVFKSFDQDNDGYITVEDLEKGLTLHQIPHSQDDTKNLFNFLDSNSNGFIEFKEFSRKIQPNIITANKDYFKEDEYFHMNVSQPSTFFYETQKNKLPPLFNPKTESIIKVATRYGSTPPYKNTFPSFSPEKESPMFLDNSQRYYGKRFEPINFGHEDKNKNKKSLDAKIEVIRSMRENSEQKAKIIDDKVLALDERNLKVIQGMRMEYERKFRNS